VRLVGGERDQWEDLRHRWRSVSLGELDVQVAARDSTTSSSDPHFPLVQGHDPARSQNGMSASTPILHFTGHALVDVGIAGLVALADKKAPDDLSLEDLDGASQWIADHYYSGLLGTYLSCVFMNASFVQPSEGAEKKQAFLDNYVRAHRAKARPEVEGMRCVFSGEPATSPMVRTHLPLFSGEGVMNFRPDGGSFVPVAGAYVVAILFLPMASRRSEGSLLCVHADDPMLTLRFARRYLADNRRLIGLALPTAKAPTHPGFDRELPMWDATKKRYKMADAKGPRSLVVQDLTEIAGEALPNDLRPHPSALTAYLLSNSGQGPSLEIFHVPSGVVAFVARASGAGTAKAWKAIATRFWPLSQKDDSDGKPNTGAKKAARKRAAAPIAGRAGWTRNPAFEDLCGIFEAGFTDRAAAAHWLRRYVLGRRSGAADDSARYGQGDARSWKLAELFLREVLGMKDGRIKAIREFSDKLAEWINKKADKRLYRALVFGKLSELQHHLRRVQRESAGSALLFGLDEYRNVWLHEDGDRYLVRDLVCIRLIERLDELGYFKAHPEDIVDTEEEDREASEEVSA
jgi:CRISPR-associated protein Cst1